MSATDKWIANRFANWRYPVTPAMRRRAAQLCSMMACSESRHSPGWPEGQFSEPCDAIGVRWMAEDGAAELARLALWSRRVVGDAREDWAEAESLLRCGWSPGDEL